MDTLPPQAPPSFVISSDDDVTHSLQRLAEVQQWLADQQSALPLPETVSSRDALLDLVDAFWHAPVSLDGATVTRRQAFATQLARFARDDANLLASDGLIPMEALDMVAGATTDQTHADVRAGGWQTQAGPLVGTVVLWRQDQPGLVLLFTTRTGWHAFDSEGSLRRHLGTASTLDEQRLIPLADKPFEAVADQLVDQFTVTLARAWDASAPAGDQARIDTLYHALDLGLLVDTHAVTGWRATLADDALRSSLAAVWSLDDLVADIGGVRPLVTIPPSVLKSAGSLFGRRMGQLARTPVLRRTFQHGDSIFDKRFIARDVTAPVGAENADGVIALRGASYVRQDGHLYQVRFDQHMQGWRLTRAGALDVNFTGPLVERLPNGRWHFRSSGLAGGGGSRPHYVSPEDWELYRPYLSEEIADFPAAEYTLLRQRMARAIGLREEVVFNALGMRQRGGHAVEISPMERELFQVYVQGIREMRTLRVTGYGTWRPEPQAFLHAQQQVHFPPVGPEMTDEQLLAFRETAMPQLATFTPAEMRLLITELQQRAGEANALRIFTTLGRRPQAGDSLLTVLPEELTHWTAAVRRVQGLRVVNPALADDVAVNLPGSSRISAEPAALEIVPEAEWPEVAYYYATPYELERFRDANVLMLSQSRPAQSPVLGVPLLTQPPETLLAQTGNVPDAWLPRTLVSIATLPAATTPLGQASGARVRVELRRMLPPPTALGARLGSPYRLYRQATEQGPMLILRPADAQVFGWWQPAILLHGGNFSIHFWPAPQ